VAALVAFDKNGFLFLTLGDVPIDVIADRLGTSRAAVCHTLQGARTKLSASLVDSEGPS
jgi:predicted DNA-binding protein (UPF0251 family)